jgi:hypothetical protein
MTWQDLVNGNLELFGGVFIWIHVRRLLVDRKVKGVSLVATVYFFAWGLWNLYYYPSLGQWVSWLGGINVAGANLIWVGLMVYYIRKERAENGKNGLGRRRLPG